MIHKYFKVFFVYKKNETMGTYKKNKTKPEIFENFMIYGRREI